MEAQIDRLLSAQADKVLAATMEELTWLREMPVPSISLTKRHPVKPLEMLPAQAAVGCQGVAGAYSHMASRMLFPEVQPVFFEAFQDVARALREGEVEYGLLPVENSSAGQVSEVLELESGSGLYIVQSVDVRVSHCLCIHPDTDPACVREVLSHPQALMQCRRFLEGKGLSPKSYSNTAAAALEISRSAGPFACICSRLGAELYGLRVLEEGIEDFQANYTRFHLLSAQHVLLPDADTVSLALSLPNKPGYLHKILTRFAACNLDLSRLTSMPIASRDFSVLFYLDFKGHIQDPLVDRLLSAMYDEFAYVRYLGNFSRR